MTYEDEMAEGDRPTRDNRKWHTSREISLPLVLSILVLLVGVVGAWYASQADIKKQGEQIAELTTTLKETNAELKAVRERLSEGSVPSALNAARITALEQFRSEDRQRIADLERELRGAVGRISVNEQRMASETLRNRASRER